MDELTRPKAEAPLPPIPDKRFFSIGEVAELCAVKPHVLRFWESEFAQLRPSKRENRRYYTKADVVLVRQICDLLYVQLFTIKGARVVLEGGGNTQLVPSAMDATAPLIPQINTRLPAQALDFPEIAEGIDRHWLQKELHSTLALLRGKTKSNAE